MLALQLVVAAFIPSVAGSDGAPIADARACADVQTQAWCARVCDDIRRGEYEFHEFAGERGVWSAPNRAQGLRTRASVRGLEVFARAIGADGLDAPWRLRLRTAAFGREDLHALDLPRIDVRANTTQLEHGLCTETLENHAGGLQQTWIVPTRVVGEGSLCVGLEVCGDVGVELDDGARSARFVDASGRVVARYRGLFVVDATGRELDARLELSTIGLDVRIDDTDAEYPLTVDPVLTGPAWSFGADQAGAALGASVSGAGDVNGDGYDDVIVGAAGYDVSGANRGRAYVFHGSASGLSATPDWIVAGQQTNEGFGTCVATAGDVNGDGYSDVIVGATLYDGGQTDEGRAYVFLGSASGLATTAAWTTESNQASSDYGASVASAGDVNGDGYSDVIVGAPSYDNGETDEGRVFVFHGSATGLATTAAWTAESDQASAFFGEAVALAGDVNGDDFSDVIVGAWRYDNGQVDEGRAFVFLGSATGLGAVAAWTAESNQSTAEFGTTVATAGDVNGDGYSDVIVGADRATGGQTDEGRAYLYLGSSTGLATSAAWTREIDEAGARFGRSVSTAGDVNRDGYADVIVGAFGSTNGENAEGRAFVYLGSASGLETSAAWSAESNQALAFFGISVATAGDVDGDGCSDVLVGAYQFDDGEMDEGGAFLYRGLAQAPAAVALWTSESNQSNGNHGFAVSSAGDVNGDGYGDVIVGSPTYDGGATDEGRALVYLGSATGPAVSAAWIVEGGLTGADFGRSVAAAGDVNGDGYGDVIVGASAYTFPEVAEGRACVYAGSAAGLSTTPLWAVEGNLANARFGLFVRSAGDVNGDGYGDIAVGTSQYSNGQSLEGAAFVYHGSPTGPATTASWSIESNSSTALFGDTVGTAGDVNGDGFGDLIVGEPGYDLPTSGGGRVLVYHGSPSGLSTTASWIANGNQINGAFGNCTASAGDVNGDGYDDVVIGWPGFDNGQPDEGAAVVYFGSPTGLAAAAAWSAESDQASAGFGNVVAGAGDVDGDGYSDVLVGAENFDNGETDEGRAFLYLGSSLVPAPNAAWTAEADQATAFFGAALDGAGDVNGDGFADVIVGAWRYDAGSTNEGRAFVYIGNDGGARTTLLRQQRTDATTPITPPGRSDSQTSFRIRATMLSVFGRTQLQMENEVKPLGALLDGTSTTPGNFFDTGTDGSVPFNRLVSGLWPGTQYHWRVRAKYDLTKTPFQRNGPWFHPPTRAWNEAQLETAGPPPPSAYCPGDGSTIPCPCANNGGTGRGCSNSLFATGALLSGAGTTSVAADTLVLSASSMTGSVAVFFQGASQLAPAIVDDGLGCVGGPIIRLGTKTVAANASSFPQSGDPLISVRGAIPPAGAVRYYQCFYRNAVAAFCPPATSNRTNGLNVTWVP